MPDTILRKSHDRHLAAPTGPRPPMTHAELAEKADGLGDLSTLSLQFQPRSEAEQSADGFNNIEELKRILMNGDGGSDDLASLLRDVGFIGEGELNSLCGIILERLRALHPHPFTDEYGIDASTIPLADAGVMSAEEQARLGISDTDAVDRSIKDEGGELLKALRDSIYGWNALAGGEEAGLAALLAFDTQLLANLRAAQAAGEVNMPSPLAPVDYGLNGLDVSLIEAFGVVPEDMQAENGWSNSETLERMLQGGPGSEELQRARGYVVMCAGGGIGGEMALEQYDGQVLAAMRAAHLPYNREYIAAMAAGVFLKDIDANDVLDMAEGMPRGPDGRPIDITAWMEKVLIDGGSPELAETRAWIESTSGEDALAEFDRRLMNRLFAGEHYSEQTPLEPTRFRFFSDANLFGDADGPRLEDINQGSLGDCYLLSVLSSLTLQQPDLIRDAIEWDPDAEVFKVTLYVRGESGEPEPKVFEVTQQELWDNIDNRGGSTLDDLGVRRLEPDWLPSNAVWPAVFEVAYAKMLDRDPEDGFEQGLEDLGDGGKPYEALFALTGQGGSQLTLAPPKKNPQAWAEGVARQVEDALSEGRPIVFFTGVDGNREKNDNGTYTRHAYAVLGVHQDRNGEWWLDLRNPHGKVVVPADDGRGLQVDQPEISIKLSTLREGSPEYLSFGAPPIQQVVVESEPSTLE